MLIDQASLFVAAGICSAALALTMLSSWLHNRADSFLIGWTLGMSMLGLGVILYYTLPADNMPVVATAFGLQTLGFVVILVSSRQFVGRRMPRRRSVMLLALVPAVILPILAGYDGAGIMVYNFVAATLLSVTGITYWNSRAEAPSSIGALTALYNLASLSFVACGTIILHEQTWSLGRHPDNWAEHFNAVMCIAGITGVGALSIGLNHARAARRHKHEAQTDALTGLLNRRALFDALSGRALEPGHAVVAFDLDRFKTINDRYGHAAGDELLRRFADAIRANLRQGDLAARIGGEEFVLVLRDASLGVATSTAERIRAIYADSQIETSRGRLNGTASAGVATAADHSETFEELLLRADTSLYRAKDGGRNRVVTQLHAVA